MSLWVTDTSPLIFLAQLERLELLRHGSSAVCCPRAVLDEVSVRQDTASEAIHRLTSDWLEVREVIDRTAVDVLRADIGAGEAEAVILAKQLCAGILVVDDLAARRLAARVGLTVVGTLGLLLAAKLRGDIASLSSEVDRLETSGFRISERLKQAVLAEAGRTSQPTIAAYESGRKIPNLRTLERLARSVGLEAIVDFVPPLTREDRRSLALHHAIAKRLEQSPESTLRRARQTLEKMRRQHPGARRLFLRWRSILNRPIEEIVEVLLDARPAGRELRHVTPFAGVLTARERTTVYLRFASTLDGRQ